MIKNGILQPAPGSNFKVNQKPTPNRSGALISPTLIVLHDTASGLDSSGPVSWLCNPAAKASAHFVVGRIGFKGKGDVWQLAPTNVKTWHAGKSAYRGKRNCNNFSLGIEIVNPGWLSSRDGGKTGTFSRGNPSWEASKYGIYQVTDDGHPGRNYWMSYTNEQIDAVIEMCRAMVAAYPTIRDIEGHFTIAPGRKVDVNPLFPMARVRAAVFNNRGPVATLPVVTDEMRNVPDLPPATAEKDEAFDFDAVNTSDLNLRPWPDSPNRLGVVAINSQIDILRQTVSQKDGAVWFAVQVQKAALRAEKDFKTDADGLYRGFVHGNYLRLVD